MRYVLDSCVAFKMLVPEVDTPKALQLRDDFLNGILELLSPDILPIEVAHALTRAERQCRITPAQGSLLLKNMFKYMPNLHPYIGLLPRAYDLSSSVRQGVYDCLYVALAEREGCELVTSDDKMVKTMSPQFPFIINLSSL